MLVLVVLAVVWVAVKVLALAALLLAEREPVPAAAAPGTRSAPAAGDPQDRPAPQDAATQRAERRPVLSFREAVIDPLTPPDHGPSCLGGRDDSAFRQGWDDAVDWIGRGQDARPPTWGDLAYMTGWYQGVRDVAVQRAR